VRTGATGVGVVLLASGCAARSERMRVLRMAMVPAVRAPSTTAPMASAPTEAAPPECRVTARVRTEAPGVGIVSLGSGFSYDRQASVLSAMRPSRRKRGHADDVRVAA